MEIGDLWTGVQWGLTRPGTRIPTFGKLATSSQERKSFKKIAQEEAQVIRMAKRVDVGEELTDSIQSNSHCTRTICEHLSQPCGLSSSHKTYPTLWWRAL